MTTTKQTKISKDATNKKLIVTRAFDAPLDAVWKAWTDSKLLEQWWAPKPWKAKTKSMDFREGGSYVYSMVGPEGEEHFCRFDYKSITPGKSYSGIDAFTDEKGTINNEFPRMNWVCKFNERVNETEVEVEITFDSEEDLNKIVEMGFKEGFTMAHGNLDELLAR